MPRTTIEVDSVVLKAIKIIAHRRRLKIKAVSNVLLRYAIPWEAKLFAPNNRNKNKDNGK